MAAQIYIGTQGWNYDGWKGAFYPRNVQARETLSLYAKVFDTVEIDSTFYAIPSESSVRGWAARTPPNFKFSVKLPSEITHKNRLTNSAGTLREFLNRISLLGEKLGSILIQLPPDFSTAEYRAFSEFIKLLPAEMRFAVEFRDAGWLRERVIEELREKNVALALTDSRWIGREESFRWAATPTSTFAYVRWLGPREMTDFSRIQIDRTIEMRQWAEAFAPLSNAVETIFGYFNNHFQGHSPASANIFKRLIGLQATDPDVLIVQPSLF